MRPVALALTVIEAVAELQPIGTSDLARRLGLPKATVHRLLTSLEYYRWVERDGGTRPRWSITVKPISIGGRAIESKGGLRIAALSTMDALRHATGETVHLGLRQGDKMLLIERIDGFRSVSVVLPVGTSWDLSWSSSGRALLAHLPEADQKLFLSIPRFRRKSETDVISTEEFMDELVKIRERGFAYTVGRPPASSSSVGVAIFDKTGSPVAGLSVTGSADRLREEQLLQLAPHVIEAGRRISMGMSI